MEKQNLTIEQIHRMKIRQGFSPYGAVQILTKEECRLIMKYGAWLRALGEEIIPAFTNEQKRFVLVVAGLEAPCTIFENLWVKFLRFESEYKEKSRLTIKNEEREQRINKQVLSDRVEQNQAAVGLRKIERYQNYAAMKYRCGACDRPVDLCSCGD